MKGREWAWIRSPGKSGRNEEPGRKGQGRGFQGAKVRVSRIAEAFFKRGSHMILMRGI